MADPENGELLLDLGFGIHPPEGSEVVGFWDVEVLRLGFDYGGYSQGAVHGVGTASAIGAIQAEMTVRRKKRTHISYRLAYNLSYEALRGQKTRHRECFFPFLSAYLQDKKYRDSVQGLITAYERCARKKKSFGVRDEYRCRASSVKRLLPHLKNKVRGRPQPKSALPRENRIVLNHGSAGQAIRQRAGPHHLAVKPRVVYLRQEESEGNQQLPGEAVQVQNAFGELRSSDLDPHPHDPTRWDHAAHQDLRAERHLEGASLRDYMPQIRLLLPP